MAIKIDVTFQMFCETFHKMGRGEQFTYYGLKALFDYLNNMDEDYNLDVVELCCNWSEYMPKEYHQTYNEYEQKQLHDNGMVIECYNGNFLVMT